MVSSSTSSQGGAITRTVCRASAVRGYSSGQGPSSKTDPVRAGAGSETQVQVVSRVVCEVGHIRVLHVLDHAADRAVADDVAHRAVADQVAAGRGGVLDHVVDLVVHLVHGVQ